MRGGKLCTAPIPDCSPQRFASQHNPLGEHEVPPPSPALSKRRPRSQSARGSDAPPPPPPRTAAGSAPVQLHRGVHGTVGPPPAAPIPAAGTRRPRGRPPPPARRQRLQPPPAPRPSAGASAHRRGATPIAAPPSDSHPFPHILGPQPPAPERPKAESAGSIPRRRPPARVPARSTPRPAPRCRCGGARLHMCGGARGPASTAGGGRGGGREGEREGAGAQRPLGRGWGGGTRLSTLRAGAAGRGGAACGLSPRGPRPSHTCPGGGCGGGGGEASAAAPPRDPAARFLSLNFIFIFILPPPTMEGAGRGGCSCWEGGVKKLKLTLLCVPPA